LNSLVVRANLFFTLVAAASTLAPMSAALGRRVDPFAGVAVSLSKKEFARDDGRDVSCVWSARFAGIAGRRVVTTRGWSSSSMIEVARDVGREMSATEPLRGTGSGREDVEADADTAATPRFFIDGRFVIA
jgi:hypothetical protein